MPILQIVLLSLLTTFSLVANAQSAFENRGLVAVPAQTQGVFLSWRFLKTDADDVAFDVYRVSNGESIKVNSTPIATATNFVDANGSLTGGDSWYLVNTKTQRPSREAHSLQARDVDGDGKDEDIIGALVLDDNGQSLYSLAHRHKEHVDHVYIGDLDPRAWVKNCITELSGGITGMA